MAEMTSTDNSGMLAELMAANGRTADLGAIAAMLNKGDANGGQWNNPFMYLIWLALLGRGGLFGGAQDAVGNAEVLSKLNDLGAQASANQNTNLMMDSVNGNHEALHGIANALGLNASNITNAINSASLGSTIGNKDLQSAIQSCCCSTQKGVLEMGYQSQIRDLQNTAALNSRLDQLANGVQTGFANIGYQSAQNTAQIIQSQTANTQRIIDQMCSNTTQELRDKLAQMSQEAQTNALSAQINSLKCGCGC